jgi:dienelactone hydrolase
LHSYNFPSAREEPSVKHLTYLPLLSLVLLAAPAHPEDTDAKPADSRLHAKLRDLNDKDFFFRVPESKEAWQKRRQAVREQILVATGLWPLPEKTPLHPSIHGKIDRDEYTIEKVFFASYPGHYVSGNLYRPKGKSGKLPGVLCPHGHWANGRFNETDEKTVAAQMKQGAEKTPEGAKYLLQARCAQLARMGCVVFHYDMVGNADSTAIEHRKGFTDADAELRLQSFMGLQTWNSIRSLDFLLSLPDVDAKRIGVTGASGGGTQTFILCAIDDRPTVAFPAVMVGTAMQGGCVCENCSHLRVGTGNVEIAGLFAPKPLAMSGANDWTIDIERKGLPELKELYKLYGAEDRVMARCFPQFGHNYNQVSREVMYNWFNKHLKLGLAEPVVEKPFQPVPPKELSVFDAEHPRPDNSVDAARLRQYMTEQSDKQIEALRPKEGKSLTEYRRIFGAALRAMIHDDFPDGDQVEEIRQGEMEKRDGYSSRRFFLTRKGQNERIPVLGLLPPEFDGTVVVWIHPRGKASLFQDSQLVPAAKQILERKAAILAVDVFGTGELSLDKPRAVNPQYAGFTFGYNRTLLAERIHDILTATAFAKNYDKVKTVHLVSFDKAGPWVLLARGLCGDAVSRTAADGDSFRFDKVRTTSDEMMLPGALKYGGLPALAALAAPGELFFHNHRGTGSGQWLKTVYEAADAKDKHQSASEKVADEKVVGWLLR